MKPLALISTVSLALGAYDALADAPPAQTNPFAQPPGFDTRAGAAPAGMTLRATLIDGQRALANINGELLAVGDVIGRATVTRIALDRVELTTDGKTLALTLRKPETEQTQETQSSEQEN